MLETFFRIPFANAGDKVAIPEPTQGDGSVSYNTGFGPDYELPYSNPNSKDVPRDQSNQLSYAITKALQEYQTNGIPDWITNAQNNGVAYLYPANAHVRYTDGLIYVALEATNALPTDGTKWALMGQGITAITGLTNANVVLTDIQASRPIITLAGGLTGNIQIIVPNKFKQWVFNNLTTGNFSITVKTAAGLGVLVFQGQSLPLYCNGVDVKFGAPQMISRRIFNAPGAVVYTKTVGTAWIDVLVQGAGGGGGGAQSTAPATCASGSGGGGGGWARRRLTSGYDGATITVGAAGAGGVIAPGVAGGSSSFGALVSATGGGGGSVGNQLPDATSRAVGFGAPGIGSSGDINARGGVGQYAFYSTNPASGQGGGSFFGSGAEWVVGYASGTNASVSGAGGAGGNVPASNGGATGGSGANGIVIVEEWA